MFKSIYDLITIDNSHEEDNEVDEMIYSAPIADKIFSRISVIVVAVMLFLQCIR